MRLMLAIFRASLASASAKQCPATAIDDATSYQRPNLVFIATDTPKNRGAGRFESEA